MMDHSQYTLSKNSIDITGQRFGKLVALERAGRVKRVSLWLCRCDCGREKVIRYGNLASGHTQSCGCSWREAKIKRNTTHGRAYTRTYKIWAGMLKRCRNPKSKQWSDYGGRGIEVCEKWHTFENFYADMGDCPDGYSIERIEVNGHYEPGNCKWATSKEQSRNRRDRKRYDYNGESFTLAEWSEKTGISVSSLWARLKFMTIEEALTLPRYARRWKKRPNK